MHIIGRFTEKNDFNSKLGWIVVQEFDLGCVCKKKKIFHKIIALNFNIL